MVQEYGTYKEPGFREAGSPFVTTVFIALATVFVAMTTVFMQGELRTSEPWRRSSWEFSAHLAENTSGNVCCRCWRNLLERWFWQLFSCFYNIPRFPRYFYRFSVRSVSLKIKLIVIPGLLYGFSKYPLVWIETVAHEIRISTPYFLRNSCFCKMLNNRKIQIYAFWRGVLCVLTSFEVWCSVFLRSLQDYLL